MAAAVSLGTAECCCLIAGHTRSRHLNTVFQFGVEQFVIFTITTVQFNLFFLSLMCWHNSHKANYRGNRGKVRESSFSYKPRTKIDRNEIKIIHNY